MKNKKLVKVTLFMSLFVFTCSCMGYVWHKANKAECAHKEHVRHMCMNVKRMNKFDDIMVVTHPKPHPIHPVESMIASIFVVGQVMNGVPGQTMVA